MQPTRSLPSHTIRCVVITALTLVSRPMSAAPQRAPRGEQIAPLSYVCPMPADAEVLEDQPGTCRKCGMALQPIRLDLRYACPIHPTYVRQDPGKHSVDGRDLVPVTLSVSWTCGDQAFLEPGPCANGGARTVRYEQRPHGDHNPKHGGLFFMAPDGWHHLEGTYPARGLFRLYFYDDYSKPLQPAGFTATVSILDAGDAEIVKQLPLKRARISNAMEVSLPAAHTQTPVRLLARVTFATGSANPFNFQFADVTKDAPPTAQRSGPLVATGSGPALRTGETRAAPTPAPAAAPPSSRTAIVPASSTVPAGTPAALVAAVDEASLPTSVPGLLAELTKRAGEVGQHVKDGNLGDVWVPAMGTKTVALVLESHTKSLSGAKQAAASMAIRRIVMSAWDLDAFGDLGNKPKMEQAYQRLAVAVSALKGLYEAQ